MTARNYGKLESLKSELLNVGMEILGAASGAAIGSSIAGPVGNVVGGGAGPALTYVIKMVGEFAKRT